MVGLPTPVTFDYEVLDTETRLFVQKATHEIQVALRMSARYIVAIGSRLLEVKACVGHTHFENWLLAEFELSARTAQRYMSVAEVFGDSFKNDTVSFLVAAKALYMLAAPSTPEEAREEAIQRIQSGERITATKAKRIIDGHNQQPLPYPIHPEGLDASVSPDDPPDTSQKMGKTADGHVITEAGEILRYVPGGDRAWCAQCNDWRNFRLSGAGQDVWACKVCDHHVLDEMIVIYEPPAAIPAKPSQPKPQPTLNEEMVSDLHEAERLLRKWWDWLPQNQTRQQIDMALVAVRKASRLAEGETVITKGTQHAERGIQ